MSADSLSVVYIGGCSYSGSTLLGALLGSDSRAFFAGEVNQYMRRLDLSLRQAPDHFYCTCGLPFEGCPVWSTLHRPGATHRNLNPAPGFSRRNLEMLSQLLRPARRRGLNDLTGDYEAVLAAIAEAARDLEGGAEWLVDSSKSLQSLDAIARSPRVRVVVLHLVRGAPGVLASAKSRGVGGLYMLAAWVLSNSALLAYCRSHRIPRLAIDYEKLCRRPEEVLDRINGILGTSLSPDGLVSGVAAKGYHLLGGNSGVRKILAGERPFSGLRFDEGRDIGGFRRALVGALSEPWRRLFLSGAGGAHEVG